MSENDNKKVTTVPSVVEGEMKPRAIKGVVQCSKGVTTTDDKNGGSTVIVVGEMLQSDIEVRVEQHKANKGNGVAGVVSDEA